MLKLFDVAVICMAVLVAAVAACSPTTPVAEDKDTKADTAVDAFGKLDIPISYRINYQYLGTWTLAKDQDTGSEKLHVFYASPGTIAAYRKDGHVPDGTVLVKEVYRAAAGAMTTGTVSHADSLRGWFVMVRDRNGRHAQNDVWGGGWGWSWFDAGNPSVASRNLPAKDGIGTSQFAEVQVATSKTSSTS